MILTAEQINELLKIIDQNQALVIGKELGTDFLTEVDKSLLKEAGVDLATIYSEAGDTLFTNFHLGMLSESLGAIATNKLTYDTLKEYISKGHYIPLTAREKATIQSARNRAFTDVKAMGGRIFQDVTKILADSSLKTQREFLRDELVSGTTDKKTVTEIAHTIAEKTGDWSRDFERIIAYSSHLVFEEGKAAMIERNNEGEDPTVYKTVFAGACKHCIRLYLTDGISSQPRLFKLSQLRANGTNIGRKVKDWKAVLGALHPYCRCSLNHLPKGYKWNNKTKRFEASAKETSIPKRKPIRVTIGGIETTI